MGVAIFMVVSGLVFLGVVAGVLARILRDNE